MGKKDEKAEKKNGATQQPEAAAEQAPPVEMPCASHDDGGPADTSPAVTIGETTATEVPQDEPGPEDFERHDGKRLLADHERDLQVLEDVERRIKSRGPVIAARAMKSGARNPIIKIGNRVFTPRKRPEKAGGGIGLAEVGDRSEVSIG